jgi:HEAT repeat protein
MKEPIDNEPAITIKGGTLRTSKRIDRAAFPALAVRQRVLGALRAHDPDSRSRITPALTECDAAMIRIIAQEGAISNAEPTVRYNAIAALASSAHTENLNLLIDLAHFGEDFYVRGHALLALGASGMHLALPAISSHLSAADNFEKSAARRAVALIAAKTSLESVMAHAALLEERSRAEVVGILGELGKPRKRGEVRMTPQRRNGKTQ